MFVVCLHLLLFRAFDVCSETPVQGAYNHSTTVSSNDGYEVPLFVHDNEA